jgi:hypothetical protein
MVDMIFKPAARYPADPRAVFILALSVFSGLTSLALQVAPNSLEALLPTWGVFTWGALLTVGSALTLIGMLFQSINGIIAEQIGSVMVGATTIFYSGLVFWVVGSEAIQTVGIIMAWGIACFIRWGQLQVLIHDALKRKTKIEFLQKFEVELAARQERERQEREHRER